MDYDALSNEELAVLVAEKVMGWHKENRSRAIGSLPGKTPWWVDENGKAQQLVVRPYYLGGFSPADEGNEHQAKLVETKVIQLGWHVTKHGPRLMGDWEVAFWLGATSALGEAPNEGRANCIAALRAVEGAKVERVAPK